MRNSMERTKTKMNKDAQIQALSQLVSRVMLASKLGMQYGTDRDLYQALGYPLTITYTDYAERHNRQDIARAVIDRPVKVTWQGDLAIIESDDDEETALEKAWKDLENRLGLKSRFMRLDKLAGIGAYGVLLLGLSDVGNRDDFASPVTSGQKKLLYVKPLGQGSAEISTWESHSKNPRYGLPLTYSVKVTESSSDSSSQIRVHHSRIIHVTDETLESEIEGTPRLEPVYNRLMDLEKLVGGDAEMFWRNARPGYSGELKEGFKMTATELDDLKDQIDEYEHGLRRFLINEGLNLKALTQQMADPKSHVDVQIQMISAVTGIPKRILTGSERGELSSSEDKGEWLTFVKSRREEYAEPRIIRPFVDRCIKYGILPPPKDSYFVQWEDLFAQSEKERVEIGKFRAEALSKYLSNPAAEMVLPPDSFLEYFLGFTDEEIEMIKEARDAAMLEEQRMIKEGKVEEEPEEEPEEKLEE